MWLRKALFQIHLWTGIGTGLYVLLVSVSGSAIVFRNELYNAPPARPKVAAGGPRLNAVELRDAVHRAYPGSAISNVFESKDPSQPAEIWFDVKGHKKQRFFDPYTGRDLGNSVPNTIKVLSWMGDLHANLFAGDTGRKWNGVGAAFLTVLCMTGMVIWWPGTANWRRSLLIDWKSNWKRLNWDLHSAVGFWTVSVLLMWALNGVYLDFRNRFSER